jgi:hypothetical protein
MLYDKRWDKVAINPLTLEALISWLEKFPPEKTYDYMSVRWCLAARYNHSIKRKYEVSTTPWRTVSFDDKLEYIALVNPPTFGAALARARGMLEGAEE